MVTDPHPGYRVPDPHRHPRDWTASDSDNLDKIARAQGVLTGLLALTMLLLAASLVLGVIGYSNVTERLDNIEDSAARIAVKPQSDSTVTP